jgi:Tfp pilus assembly protein PilV
VASTPRRRIDTGQDGFALIEVLISGLIAVLVAGAVMTLFAATERSAADSRHRSQASAVAQEDQARMRAMRIPSLYKYSQSRPVAVDGTTYTVESTGKYINDKTGSDLTCASGNQTVDYVQIGTRVTWPGMRSGEAVTMKGLIAPPTGSLDPTKGTLVFMATNAAGTPLAGLGVSGGGAGTFSGTTSTAGCAVFLEQTAGAYTLTVSGVGSGLVDQDGNAPAPKPIKVNPEVTTTVPLLYDQAGSVKVKFTTRNYSGNVVTAKAPSFIVYNSNMTTAKLVGSPEGTPFESQFLEKKLFPFTSPDVIYAGACSVHSPGGGPAMASVAIPAGGTAPEQTVRMPSLLLTVNKELGVVASGAEVLVTDTQCETGGHGIRKTFTTNSSGQLNEPGLPWSTYQVCASVPYTVLLTTRYYKVTKEIEVHSDNGNPLAITVAKTDTEGKCP